MGQSLSRADHHEMLQQDLRRLADTLLQQRESILQAWRLAIDRAPEITTAAVLTRTQFNDHVPQILDELDQRLRSWPASHSEATRSAQAVEHGIQRWQQGYQLPEMISEWGHFQSELMTALDHYALAHPELDARVMPTARRVLMGLSTAHMHQSASQYWHLHQSEAAGHVQDLEEALNTLHSLEQLRVQLWHQAAHDLRGGLSVVQGASSELESEDLSSDSRTIFSVLLQKGVRSLHDILSDLMSLARLDAGLESRQVAPFDAAELLREFCAAALPLAHQRGLAFEMEGPERLEIQGDRAKTLRILQNLLLNSLKYTRRGSIRVSWGPSPEAMTWFFCVQDTGPGLVPGADTPLAQELSAATQLRHELEAKAPDSEQQAPAPTLPSESPSVSALQAPGEGVGLTIVKRLCDMLDASLELETRPGRGTTFRVVMPCRYALAAQEVEAL